MASIPSFIFGGNTKYKTQEELEAAREAVRAMLGDIGQSGLTGWGSFMADIGKGIGARIEKGRIDKGQEFLTGEQSKLAEMLGFGGGGDTITGGGGGVGDIVATSGADTAAGSVGTDPVNQDFTRPPPSSSGGGDGYLRYANKGATRNLPLAPKLVDALSFLGDMGVTARVVSGGQPSAAEVAAARARGIKLGRTGSVRHDHGNAADVDLYQGDRNGSWRNKGDIPILQRIVQEGKRRGITGWGAGEGYMGGDGRIHLGFGKPAVWGAGGEGANAAGRLRGAYNSADASGDIFGEGGASGQAGGAGTDPMVTGSVGAGDSFLQAQPNPARFAPEIQPAPPAPAPVPVRNVPVNDVGLRTPQGQDFLSRMGSPAPMGGQPLPMVPTTNGPMPPPPQPPQAQPVPAPPPPPAPAPVPPAPPPQVDPFTSMILGDKAAQFKPGNYIPPAPVGKQVFPVAPPAPGTPAAAGFGVPPVVGGGGADQLAGQGTFPPAPAPPQAAGGGNKIAKLQFILASPYASKEQKLMAASMIEREYALEDERRKAASPEAQLDMDYKRAQIAALGAKGDDPALVNAGGGRIYNPKTGEWIIAPSGPGGGGPFSGDSVEAQALNGMVTSGRISVQQAYDLAAGKTITDPATGAMIFMSGAELVGALPGQPPQVIQPAPQSTPAPAGSPQPAPPAPAGTPAQPPAGAPGRPLTAGKPGKLQSEGERRDQSLYSVVLPELEIVQTHFDALADPQSEMADQMPGGAYVATPEYQQAATSLRTIISSYLYSMSGATATPSEVENLFSQVKPRAGEPEASKKDKLRRLHTMAEAIRLKGGGTPEQAPAAGGGGNVDYNSIYGLPPVPK